MTKLAPDSNDIQKDDNGYLVSGIADYEDNYQSLSDVNNVVDVSPYLYMPGLEAKFSFHMTPPASLGPFTSLTHLATAKATSGIAGWAALQIRDAVTGVRALSRWWKIPADGLYHNMSYSWLSNPIAETAWTGSDVASNRYRFGLVRIADYSALRIARMYVEPV